MLPLPEIEHRANSQMCATHCPYCSLQCGMHLHADTEDDTWVVAERKFPTNRGGLCQKGWTAAELLDRSDRLSTPLVRDTRSSPLRPSTWAEALSRIVSAINQVQQAYSP